MNNPADNRSNTVSSLRWSGLLAGLAMSLLVSLLVPGPTSAQLGAGDERKALKRYEPAPIWTPDRRGPPAGAPLRLRFYMDDAYRTSTPRAQERLLHQLGVINQVMERAFGTRFEVEAIKRWERRGSAHKLHTVLEELEAHDPGTDVDWVVGLVAPLPLVTTSIHDLGMARTLGRHFVLRGMSSIEEMDSFRRAFPVLDRLDRDDLSALYSRRKDHKEQVVFLHEWLHTLGAIHVGNPSRILCPTYSDQSSQLWGGDVAAAEAALADRRAAAQAGTAVIEWKALKAFMAKTSAREWYTGEKEALLAQLAGGTAGGTAAAPADDRLRQLADRVNATQALITAKDRAAALGKTRELAAELGKLPDPPPIFWIWLAQLELQLGSVTDAAQALARVSKPEALTPEHRRNFDEAQTALVGTRRFLGLPEGTAAGVAAEAEASYRETFTAAHELLAGQKLAAARGAIEAALRQYPRAPGLSLLACELGLRQGRVREASRRCEAALAAMDDLPRAHYLKAHVRMSLGDYPGAVTPLRRALTLDPGEGLYRETLVKLLRDLGRTREAAALVAERTAVPTATEGPPAETPATPKPAPGTSAPETPAPAAAAKPRRPFDAFAPPPVTIP